jgi:hypothetical protein
LTCVFHARQAGAYRNEEEAAQAHDLAALKYWGTTVYTNFPVLRSMGVLSTPVLLVFIVYPVSGMSGFNQSQFYNVGVHFGVAMVCSVLFETGIHENRM